MQKMVFNRKVQKKYMTKHDLVVKAKFYFLKSIQSTSNEQNASLNRQKEMTKEVSDGLDSIL